jgi:hypothetical protein
LIWRGTSFRKRRRIVEEIDDRPAGWHDDLANQHLSAIQHHLDGHIALIDIIDAITLKHLAACPVSIRFEPGGAGVMPTMGIEDQT